MDAGEGKKTIKWFPNCAEESGWSLHILQGSALGDREKGSATLRWWWGVFLVTFSRLQGPHSPSSRCDQRSSVSMFCMSLSNLLLK